MKIQANDQGFFVVTFFNELDPEKNLTEKAVMYIFSKFGLVSEIKYAEHGQVFISYKEKEGALKALEIVNMGTKYHVETEWQTVKKNEIVQSIKSEEDPFIYLRIPPFKKRDGIQVITYIIKTLVGFDQRSKIKDVVSSWIFDYHVKIVFDSKVSKEEIRKKHQENPFKWPKEFGNFEFCQDVPIAYIICPEPKLKNGFWGYHVKQAIFGNEKNAKIKNVLKEKSTSKFIKVIFDAKVTKDEVMEAHQRKPFKWPENFGVFEFLNTSEALSIAGSTGRIGKKKED